MFIALNGPAIGIKGMALPALMHLAQTSGFEGLDFDIREAQAFAKAHSISALKDLFAKHEIRPAAWNLPVSGAQTEWQVDLAELRELAKLAAAIGANRCITWVPSWHDTKGLVENRAYHVQRFRDIARALQDGNCTIGLEFLGPKTLQTGHTHKFISRMEDMLALANNVGTSNVGLLVDAYHLYTGGGTWDDLAKVPVERIVHVHINDALAGIAIDDLPDGQRALPLETGVIDLAGFMRALKALGYAGPVVTEPFSARLNEVAASDPPAAAQEVAKVMRKVMSLK